jgi:hypothetical protein
MQIIENNNGTREVYDLPSAALLKTWPVTEYRKLHKALCDFFSIPVPADFNAQPRVTTE